MYDQHCCPGPGWFPGLPRLGDNDSCPEVPRRAKHYSGAAPATHAYLLLQLVGVFIVHDELVRSVQAVVASKCASCRLQHKSAAI